MGTFRQEDTLGWIRDGDFVTETHKIIEQDALMRKALTPERFWRDRNWRMDSENWLAYADSWNLRGEPTCNPGIMYQSWTEHDELRKKQKAASWCKSIRESIPDEKC